MIKVITPFCDSKNLGRAYNEQISYYNSDDWICIKDHDVLFLTPDTISHIDRYTKTFPDTGIFTCYTNRIANVQQLLTGRVSEDDGIRNHIKIAEKQKERLYKVTELKRIISGFLMVINKRTWEQIKFDETGQALGVDNLYSKKVLISGRKILRMEGIYVFHTYRINNGIKHKAHLI